MSRQAALKAVHAGRIRAHEVHGPDGELAALVVEPGALERPEAKARRRKRYLSLAAAGARMGVSRMTALREVRAGRLQAIEVEGPGGSLAMLVVTETELARVMRGREA